MNKIKSILFISSLAIASASYGDHGAGSEFTFQPAKHEVKIYGCNPINLNIAYHKDLCNTDSTFKKDAPTDLIWNALIWQQHKAHTHTHVPGQRHCTDEHGIPCHPKANRMY